MMLNNYINKIINLGDEQFECVFEMDYDSKHILLLHPTDAPKGMMFVVMYINEDEDIIPVTNQMVAERILNLYEQKEHIDTKQIALSYNSE